jgi:hypothetical protein
MVCAVLSGCAGGGGADTPPAYLRAVVPYHTPVVVDTIEPLINNAAERVWAVSEVYTADLAGTGVDHVIHAGRQTGATTAAHRDARISVFGWSGNSMVNQTSQWFTGTDNVIIGTEPSVKFADFDQDGRLDMFVANGTDGLAPVLSSQVFFNEGGRFRRHEIDYQAPIADQPRPPGTDATWVPENYTWYHDSQVVDVNQDGRPDILTSGYKHPSVSFSNGDGTFSTHIFTQQSSSMAGADWLGNGTVTFLGVDSPNPGFGARPDLFGWEFDADGKFRVTLIGNDVGPTPRFFLPKYDDAPYIDPARRNHDVRVRPVDWNDDGLMDAIVISRPWVREGVSWNSVSEVQFIRNMGGGVFTDATDDVLIGYDINTHAAYDPQFVDFNGDGLTDIFLSGPAWGNDRKIGQVLIKTSDGKYVASHVDVLTDLSRQLGAMSGHGITLSAKVMQGPDGERYLVSNVNRGGGREHQETIYIAKLGASVVATEQAVSAVQALWPWMSAPQVNEVLARTQATYLDGALADLSDIMQPVGGIGITLQGQGSWLPISGHIAGLELESSIVRVTDALGRDFSVNLASMVSGDAGIWTRSWFGLGQESINSQGENLISAGAADVGGMRLATDTRNFSVGTPALKLNANWSVNAQYTNLPFNPWLQLDGVWGHVVGSGMLENVFTYRSKWFQGQAGVVNVATDLVPGLVSRVTNMTALWTEVGYRDEAARFGLFGGVRPVVVAGHAEADLPTGVDQQGNLSYSRHRLEVASPVTLYARAHLSGEFTRGAGYRLSALYMQNGQYRAMGEFTISY